MRAAAIVSRSLWTLFVYFHSFQPPRLEGLDRLRKIRDPWNQDPHSARHKSPARHNTRAQAALHFLVNLNEITYEYTSTKDAN